MTQIHEKLLGILKGKLCSGDKETLISLKSELSMNSRGFGSNDVSSGSGTSLCGVFLRPFQSFLNRLGLRPSSIAGWIVGRK